MLALIQVNSSAAVPSTSTTITMPLRKNLGFNEGASGYATTPVRRQRGEYTAGGHDDPMTDVLGLTGIRTPGGRGWWRAAG